MLYRITLLLCSALVGYSIATGHWLAVGLGVILCTWLVLEEDPFHV